MFKMFRKYIQLSRFEGVVSVSSSVSSFVALTLSDLGYKALLNGDWRAEDDGKGKTMLFIILRKKSSCSSFELFFNNLRMSF